MILANLIVIFTLVSCDFLFLDCPVQPLVEWSVSVGYRRTFSFSSTCQVFHFYFYFLWIIIHPSSRALRTVIQGIHNDLGDSSLHTHLLSSLSSCFSSLVRVRLITRMSDTHAQECFAVYYLCSVSD